jgi:hypothetical protein
VASAGQSRARAIAHARRIEDLELRLAVRVEPAIQARLTNSSAARTVTSAVYIVSGPAMSLWWLRRLRRAQAPEFVTERRAVTLAFLGALPVFAVFPVAPPKDLDDYVDTLLDVGIDLNHPRLTPWYNRYSAMPSLHVALTVVAATGARAKATSPLARFAWRAHPWVAALSVMATGNHFLADVIAGAVLGVAARRLVTTRA